MAAQGVALSTQLPQILSSAAQQQNGMSTIVAIASVQLVLLSVWILGNLLVRSTEARQAEMRVARLRGFPPFTLLAVTSAEPVILCVLGFALGVAVAWAAVVVARNRLLDPASVISPDVWVFAALALTVLAIAGALFVATLRFLRSSGLSGEGSPAPATARPWGTVADVVLLVLAAVALVALATSGSLGGRSDPIASAAPGLIALGTAVVAVQFVRLVCRVGVSASADSERVAAFLALRQVVRRPAVLRVGRVLIIALCLACFASAAWSVARSNRGDRGRIRSGIEGGSDGDTSRSGPRTGRRPRRPAGAVRDGCRRGVDSERNSAGGGRAATAGRRVMANRHLGIDDRCHQSCSRPGHHRSGRDPP